MKKTLLKVLSFLPLIVISIGLGAGGAYVTVDLQGTEVLRKELSRTDANPQPRCDYYATNRFDESNPTTETFTIEIGGITWDGSRSF